jgi:hypothetical protein
VALADAGLRITVSLDRSRRDVPADERRRFPVARVLDGIDAARAAWPRIKVNMVVKGENEASIVPIPAGPATKVDPPPHQYGCRDDQRLAPRRCGQAAIDHEMRRPTARATGARLPAAGGIETGSGEMEKSSPGQPAVLRRPPDPASAEGKMYTSLFSARAPISGDPPVGATDDLRAIVEDL